MALSGAEKQRRYRERHPERARESRRLSARRHSDTRRRYKLMTKYGITPEKYDELLEHQGGVCAICGTDECATGRPLAVDHDHESGEVRGLLCFACNTGIGKLGDRPDLLRRAAEYLEQDTPKILG